MPCHDGVCVLNLRGLAMYPRCKSRESQTVYMLDTGKVVSVCYHADFRARRIHGAHERVERRAKRARPFF